MGTYVKTYNSLMMLLTEFVFRQQLIQSVGENSKLGFSLEDIIKWYVRANV